MNDNVVTDPAILEQRAFQMMASIMGSPKFLGAYDSLPEPVKRRFDAWITERIRIAFEQTPETEPTPRPFVLDSSAMDSSTDLLS